MKKVIIHLFSVVLVALAFNANAQCPSYSAPTSGTEACANVPYYFEIPNTDCPSSVTWTIEGNSGVWGNEISWQVTNLQTGTVVASYGTFGSGNTGPGAGNTPGEDFTFTIGPDPVANVGTSYNLEYHDTAGDGFQSNGIIEVKDFNGNVITTVIGNFGTSGNSGFATPQQVSSVSATITTSQGVRNIPLVGCAPIFEEYTFVNASYCTTTTENVAWSLVCDETSAVLESGNMDITVYPSIPTATSDVVTIAATPDGCGWTATPVGDCGGSEYTISPDPATTAYTDGQSGSETFTVTYIGVGTGPDCCLVAGPAIPDSFTEPAPTTSATASDSPFGGTLNSALVTTGPYGQGGVAVSGSFDVTVSGYDYPDDNRASDVDAGSVCIPGSVTTPNFWTTIYVDGTLVSDEQTDPVAGTVSQANPSGTTGTASAGGYTITISFADIQTAGVTFSENSVIEAYVYPNSFSGPSQTDGAILCGANPTVVTTFSPGAALTGPGEWDAAVIEISEVLFEFAELVPGPADCTLDQTEAYNCVAPACTPNAGTISTP